MRIEKHRPLNPQAPLSYAMEVDGDMHTMYHDGTFIKWGRVELEWKRTPLDSLLESPFRWWYTFI